MAETTMSNTTTVARNTAVPTASFKYMEPNSSAMNKIVIESGAGVV